ncbi:MAG: T9SS type A sorting domain-containing protein [Williamsia sp.]|nr:T9SS type A sorting domain-containing protein [Williamsia sp.]
MKKVLLFASLFVVGIATSSQAQNVFSPTESVTTFGTNKPSAPANGTMAKWGRTVRMSWNTDKFKAYIWNGMPFRLRYPSNYNAADTTKKYPVMIFFHGAGEIANIYDNENQLIWGAQLFESMMNTGKAGSFDAFLLFPQVSVSSGWNDSYYTRVNSVLDSLQKYCRIDPDRIVTQGLSNGGFGALAYTTLNPTRVANSIAASPALVQTLIYRQDNSVHIPMWISSGGKDINPSPAEANQFTDSFRAIGGNIRYTYFPNNGHDTWQDQWKDTATMVAYWNAAYKSNPLLFFQKSQYCTDSAFSARMGITAGYYQYEWQRNGVTIPNATQNEYSATQIGTYRCRFKRTAESAWSVYSPNPIVITAAPSTTTPPVQVSGISSKVLPAPDGNTATPLELPTGYGGYEWRNATTNALLSSDRVYAAPVGQYKAKAFGCNPSTSSFTIISAAGLPHPDSAYNLTLSRLSSTSVKLTWANKANPANDETGFEIYRGTSASGPYTMAYLNPANSLTYTDSNIAENYNFYYLVRAVNNNGAAPVSNQATLQPGSDVSAPTAPTNLKVVLSGQTSLQVIWDKATDNVGATQYDVYVNGVKKASPAINKAILNGLTPNTTYWIKIKALDQAGNSSSFSDSVKAVTVANGLKSSYYEGNWNVLPDFSKLTPIKVDTLSNININRRNVNDYFGFVFEGYINIKTPGTYTFETSSDDGSKVYFNTLYDPAATPIVSNDGIHGSTPTVKGSITVDSAGMYPFTVTYFDKNGGEAMSLYWQGPGIPRQQVPDSAFTEKYQLPVDNTAPTAPGKPKALFTSRTYVDLSWKSSTDNITVAGYEVWVNNVKKYITSDTTIRVDSLTPNVAYIFKIKAFDYRNNFSAFGDTLKVTTGAYGLLYKYYEGTWTTLPDYNTLTPEKSGASSNISLTPRQLEDYYAFTWEGYINIKTPGTYTFETISDDGSKIYFNTPYSPAAGAIVNNDGVHGAISATGTVKVDSAGMYPITITYFENAGGQSMQAYWQGPGIARQLIPDSAFTEKFSLPVDNIKPTAPTNLKTTFVTRSYMDLVWNKATDNTTVQGYEVWINGAKKYVTADTTITADSLTAGTAYTFKVRAFDLAGNLSSYSDSVKVTAAATSLKYNYYEGTWNTLPDFSLLTPVKTGAISNVDISPRRLEDYFALTWEGYINLKAAGTYTFETISDDGSKVYVGTPYSFDGPATVNNDGAHPAVSATGTFTAPAPGMYPITITYFENSGGQSMQLYWQGPGIGRQLIPDSAFTEKFSLATDVTPPAAPTNLKTTFVSRTFMELAWNKATDNVAATGYEVWINGAKKYLTSDTTIKADSLTAGAAYTFKIKAFDLAGNISAFSDSLKVTAAANGLKYKYYEGTWTTLPNFSTLTPYKTGAATNVNLNQRRLDDYFAFTWEGYINLKTAGTYTFETVSDDGSKVYVGTPYSFDGPATVNNDGAHPAVSATGTFTAPAPGLYPITITFFENSGGESMQLYWQGPSIARQLIPDSAFTEKFSLPADLVSPTAPTNLKSTYISRTYAELAWNKATDNIGVTGYEVWINGAKKYQTSDTTIKADSLTAGTAYTVRIKAFDAAGNLSAFSDSLKVTPAATGLKYKYYEGSWNTLPNFSTLTPYKTGTSANVDLSPRRLDDYFAFTWEGWINLKTPGTYTFETISDDGSKVYVGTPYSYAGAATVNNDGAHAAVSATGTFTAATAGWYPITVTFFENAGGESMQLYWQGPGISRQLIPDAAFVENFQDVTPPSVPANLKSTFTTRTFVDLAWDASIDNGGVARYDVYVNGSFKQSSTTPAASITGLTAGTTYNFTVKAIDLANNVSASSSSLPVKTAANGLRYKYYQGSWNNLPDFGTLTPVKIGTTANVDLNPRTDFDNFAFVWEGYINLKTAGTYTFETVSDDGSKVYVGTPYTYSGAATVNNDGLHGGISATGNFTVSTPGWYPITVTFFEKTEGEMMQLYWTRPGQARQLIPDSAFIETGSSGFGDDDSTVTMSVGSNSLLNRITAEQTEHDSKIQNSVIYPNPFTETLNLNFYNNAATNTVDVELYDVSGRMVYNKHFGKLGTGATTLRVDLSGQSPLKAGNYFARLMVNGKPAKTWTLVKAKK